MPSRFQVDWDDAYDGQICVYQTNFQQPFKTNTTGDYLVPLLKQYSSDSVVSLTATEGIEEVRDVCFSSGQIRDKTDFYLVVSNYVEREQDMFRVWICVCPHGLINFSLFEDNDPRKLFVAREGPIKYIQP